LFLPTGLPICFPVFHGARPYQDMGGLSIHFLKKS
jgi:hypothetical protein